MSLPNRLSICIPTPGNGRPLERTLRSINHQRAAPDEVIVCHDTTEGVDPAVRALCERYDARYMEATPGYHDYGHTQIRAAYGKATGDWVLGQDDDDIFVPDAFEAIRARIAELSEPAPLMFQFVTPWREVLWAERAIALNRIGGHCLVVPNVQERLGPRGGRYQADYDFVRATVDLWGGDESVVWCENIISWTRPTPEEEARLIPSTAVSGRLVPDEVALCP